MTTGTLHDRAKHTTPRRPTTPPSSAGRPDSRILRSCASMTTGTLHDRAKQAALRRVTTRPSGAGRPISRDLAELGRQPERSTIGRRGVAGWSGRGDAEVFGSGDG